MRSSQTNERQTQSGNGYRRLTPWVLAGAMIPALLGAQSSAVPMVTVGKSAQYSIFAEHVFVVRLNDTGPRDAETQVTLEIRDAADQRRAFKSAVLRGRRSVELVLRIPADEGRQKMRGVVTLMSLNSLRSEIFAIVEDLDPAGLTIESKPPCPMAAQQPEVPSGAEGDCGGGWRVSRLTLEQASNSLD